MLPLTHDNALIRHIIELLAAPVGIYLLLVYTAFFAHHLYVIGCTSGGPSCITTMNETST